MWCVCARARTGGSVRAIALISTLYLYCQYYSTQHNISLVVNKEFVEITTHAICQLVAFVFVASMSTNKICIISVKGRAKEACCRLITIRQCISLIGRHTKHVESFNNFTIRCSVLYDKLS